MPPYTWGTSQPRVGRLITLGPFYHRGDNHLPLLENICILNRICLPHLLFQSMSPSTDLERCMHFHGNPYNNASDERNNFPAEKYQQQVCVHIILLILHVPCHPEAAGLSEWWNSLLEILFSCQVEGENSWKCGICLTHLVYAIEIICSQWWRPRM